MSEPIKPCPVCAQTGAINVQRDRSYCLACGFSVAPDVWQRLSDASTLLRAMGALKDSRGIFIARRKNEPWFASREDHDQYVIETEIEYDTPHAALIALAAKIGAK